MSYSFQVRKREGTLELVDEVTPLKDLAKHIPDGAVFTVNGHAPDENSSSIGMIGVSLTLVSGSGQDEHWVSLAAANGSYNTRPGSR